MSNYTHASTRTRTSKNTIVLVALIGVMLMILLNSRQVPPIQSVKTENKTENKTIPSNYQTSGDNLTVAEDRQNFAVGVNFTTPSNETKKEQEIGLQGYRLCQATPTTGYFCNGSAYEEFADHLEDAIRRNDFQKHASWGRRSSPVELDTATTTGRSTILFFGNSHMRQLSNEFKCQYEPETLHSQSSYENKAQVDILSLTGNLTIVSITNHYLVYFDNWAERVAEATQGQFGLQDFDAIVLGRFNDWSNSKGTTFGSWLESLANNNTVVGSPPGVKEVAAAFRGPIIVTSMFAKYDEWHFNSQKRDIEELQKQEQGGTLVAIDARAYVPTLGECGNDEVKGGNGVCRMGDEKDAKGHSASSMHRCVGSRGAHPSLVVWDIVEALHETLKEV